MVTLYVGGEKVGTWAEAEAAFVAAARTKAIEFRDAAGRVIATSVPGAEPVDWQSPPPSPPAKWDGDGKTLDEWRRELGWDEDDGDAAPIG